MGFEDLEFSLTVNTCFIDRDEPLVQNQSWQRLEVRQTDGPSLLRFDVDFIADIHDLFTTLPFMHSQALQQQSSDTLHFTCEYASDPNMIQVIIENLLSGISHLAEAYDAQAAQSTVSYMAADEDCDFMFIVNHQVNEGSSRHGTCRYSLFGVLIDSPDMTSEERDDLDRAIILFCHHEPWIIASRTQACSDRSFRLDVECLAVEFSDECIDTIMAYVAQALGSVGYMLAE